jgi:hypothetical protein
MSENDEPNQFFRDEKLDEDQLFVEVPAEQKSPYQERIPSGYDPMGEIYLRGRAYRSLSGGTIPWWVLISGWIIFGLPALFGLEEDSFRRIERIRQQSVKSAQQITTPDADQK